LWRTLKDCGYATGTGDITSIIGGEVTKISFTFVHRYLFSNYAVMKSYKYDESGQLAVSPNQYMHECGNQNFACNDVS